VEEEKQTSNPRMDAFEATPYSKYLIPLVETVV
jgi:hypothetical protein